MLRYSGASGAFLGVFASLTPRFQFPAGVGFGPDSNLYVTPLAGSEVLRFNGSTGAFLDVFTSGTGGGPFPQGDLRSPFGFTFGPDGNLYVTSAFNGQVRRYDGTTGVFIDVFARVGCQPPMFPMLCDGNPWDVTFGPDGNLYVSSLFGVERHDGLSGTFIDVFAAEGRFGIGFGPDGNLYASRGDQVLRYNGATGAFIDALSGGGLAGASFLTFRTVPEPSTLWLLSAAVVGLFAVSRRVAPARSASRRRSSDC